MKKNLVLAVAAVLALTSCGKNSKAYKDLKVQYDSIAMVNENYESDLRETDSLMAAILTNSQEITAVEGMINVNPRQGDMKKADMDRIRDNVQLISDKLQAGADALKRLEEKASKDNKRLQQSIAALRKQLDVQKARVIELTQELERKNMVIGSLDSMVNRLSDDKSQLQDATAKQAVALAAQDKELNTVRYCIGTSNDLKDMNLLKNGKVVTANANMSYFTTTDKRELNAIPTMAKRAKLLTIHPNTSYELVKDANKLITVKILDPEAFWSNSKILIIQVD